MAPLLKNTFMTLVFVLIMGCSILNNDLSETSFTSSSSFSDGSVMYAVGSSDGKVDWIVMSKGQIGERVSIGVETTTSGEKTLEQTVLWEGKHIRLCQKAGLVYDSVLRKRLPLRTGLTVSECQAIVHEKGYQVSGADFARQDSDMK